MTYEHNLSKVKMNKMQLENADFAPVPPDSEIDQTTLVTTD